MKICFSSAVFGLFGSPEGMTNIHSESRGNTPAQFSKHGETQFISIDQYFVEINSHLNFSFALNIESVPLQGRRGHWVRCVGSIEEEGGRRL